jgi:hypothetical protein
VPGTCTREAGLDGALGKDSVGTYRKVARTERRQRLQPPRVATIPVNPDRQRVSGPNKSHVKHYAAHIALNF